MADPLEALFRIVFLDTMTLSSIIDNRLHEIRLASQGGFQLETSIGALRWTLMQAQLRLPILRATIADLTRRRRSRPQFAKPSPGSRTLASRVRQRIAAVAAKAEELDAALRDELSILESRKQLLESSNISRLTELAFFFVPLTFVTSAFSMQVQELQLAPPVKSFLVAAFIAVFWTYMFRLLFNGRAFKKVSRKTERAARKYGQVQECQAVPAGVYFSFLLRGIFVYFFSMCGVFSVCLASILALWVGRSEIDSGFKTVLTVAVIFTLPLLGISS